MLNQMVGGLTFKGVSEMATIREDVWLNAPVDAVWELISDSSALHEWVPSVRSCRVDGWLRHCELDRGGTVVEQILVADDEQRRFQYSVSEGISLEYHLGTVDVVELASKGSLVIYSADVLPDSVAPQIRSVMAASLDGLATKFGRHSPE